MNLGNNPQCRTSRSPGSRAREASPKFHPRWRVVQTVLPTLPDVIASMDGPPRLLKPTLITRTRMREYRLPVIDVWT